MKMKMKRKRKSVVKCPACQREHPENTSFCNECGAYLPRGNGNETELQPPGGVTWVGREETAGAPGELSWSGVANNIFSRISPRMNGEKKAQGS